MPDGRYADVKGIRTEEEISSNLMFSEGALNVGKPEIGAEQPGDGPATPAPSDTSGSKEGKVEDLMPERAVHPILTKEQIRGMSAEELRPFFKDVLNRWRTANLFEETCEDPAKYPPIFTLKDDDTSSCVSLKRLYLAMEDVTEHRFASMCLGSWEHWEAITNSWILKPHIEKWRELLELQLKAKYLYLIKEQAESGDGPNALNATKYLLETTTLQGVSSERKEGPHVPASMRTAGPTIPTGGFGVLDRARPGSPCGAKLGTGS